MDIVYLDQNKWIELARVQSGVVTSGPIAELYTQLISAVASGQVLFPLSAAHVLETSKRNDCVSRGHLAETQAKLSRGFAYRSRAGRIEVEVRSTLRRLFGIAPLELPAHWAVGPGFLQAFESMDEVIARPEDVERLVRLNTFLDPATQYIDYMTKQDEATRREAHKKLAANVSDLVSRIEQRRARLVGATVDLRRRAYAVHLFVDYQDTFIRILNDLGYSFEHLKELGERAVRALIEEVPTLDVEAEMSARLESKTGALSPNDVFDIQSFYTAIPYSSRVVAEKASIARAQQARLDVKYSVHLSRSLEDLLGLYACS